MPAARLRVYLGVAPGVGCTHALLDEGRRRRARGTDVVVASLEARHETAAGDLPRVGDGERLDADAVLARRPQVALVDDLAAVDPSGKARWQGVEQLLAAGVDVVATMDVTAIASLGDVVGDITGAPPASTVPDRVLLGADQVELVDMTPRRCGAASPTAASTRRTNWTPCGRPGSPRPPWPGCGNSRSRGWVPSSGARGRRPTGRKPRSGCWWPCRARLTTPGCCGVPSG